VLGNNSQELFHKRAELLQWALSCDCYISVRIHDFIATVNNNLLLSCDAVLQYTSKYIVKELPQLVDNRLPLVRVNVISFFTIATVLMRLLRRQSNTKQHIAIGRTTSIVQDPHQQNVRP
jgi:hypothetical protein